MTLSPQPHVSVWLGLRKVNFAASVRVGGQPALDQLLDKAQQIGGTRFLDEQTAHLRKQIEALRAAGEVGSSLQAEVDLNVPAGDYELFAHKVDPSTAYKPLYTIDSPLHSIDWGSQVDRTSRNPDGDNGPRDNHSTFTGTTFDAVHGIAGKNVITYYFAPQGQTKIMNEGWASYWHQRIIRELDLTSDETIEFAKLNSSVVQPSRPSLPEFNDHGCNNIAAPVGRTGQFFAFKFFRKSPVTIF